MTVGDDWRSLIAFAALSRIAVCSRFAAHTTEAQDDQTSDHYAGNQQQPRSQRTRRGRHHFASFSGGLRNCSCFVPLQILRHLLRPFPAGGVLIQDDLRLSAASRDGLRHVELPLHVQIDTARRGATSAGRTDRAVSRRLHDRSIERVAGHRALALQPELAFAASAVAWQARIAAQDIERLHAVERLAQQIEPPAILHLLLLATDQRPSVPRHAARHSSSPRGISLASAASISNSRTSAAFGRRQFKFLRKAGRNSDRNSRPRFVIDDVQHVHLRILQSALCSPQLQPNPLLAGELRCRNSIPRFPPSQFLNVQRRRASGQSWERTALQKVNSVALPGSPFIRSLRRSNVLRRGRHKRFVNLRVHLILPAASQRPSAAPAQRISRPSCRPAHRLPSGAC